MKQFLLLLIFSSQAMAGLYKDQIYRNRVSCNDSRTVEFDAVRNYVSQKIQDDLSSIKHILNPVFPKSLCNGFSTCSLEFNELMLNKYWSYPIFENGLYYDYGLTEFNTFNNESGFLSANSSLPVIGNTLTSPLSVNSITPGS